MGNILYQQDRFDESLRLYRRALRYFRGMGEIRTARWHCAILPSRTWGFTRWFMLSGLSASPPGGSEAASGDGWADYNIAYLHYLRGEFNAARLQPHTEFALLEMPTTVPSALDQSDLYLELNRSRKVS